MIGDGQISNCINHIGLVLDASDSMEEHADALIKVTDSQVQYLARRSQEMDQETRVSIWKFSSYGRFRCLVWDKDVLRLPSIRSLYQTNGMTALVDAVIQATEDLGETPQRYGDHSFLLYTLTDGLENHSRRTSRDLSRTLSGLADNWTLAALVPSDRARRHALECGFPAGNVECWDTSSSHGVAEVGERIRSATDTYMAARATGIRSSRTLFSSGADAINTQTVSQAALAPLREGDYHLVDVPHDASIRDFVESRLGLTYRTGNGFYQLSKTELIQSYKELAVVRRSDGTVFKGTDRHDQRARQMVGLGGNDVRVSPSWNPEFDLFVQSTSTNRRLKAGTKFLYLK